MRSLLTAFPTCGAINGQIDRRAGTFFSFLVDPCFDHRAHAVNGSAKNVTIIFR
jgi:hypothetical protein